MLRHILLRLIPHPAQRKFWLFCVFWGQDMRLSARSGMDSMITLNEYPASVSNDIIHAMKMISPGLHEVYRARVEQCVETMCDCGWGLYDDMGDMFYEMVEKYS